MAEIKTSIDRISTKLSEYYTTEEMNSAITQSVDSITLEVSKTYATKNSLDGYTKTNEVRSKFAMDSSSVTIDTGRLTFNSNSIVINSTNFKLDYSGNVTASGTFKSVNGKWEALLNSGVLKMTYDGNQRVSIFKATNYDAGYVNLTGIYDAWTYNAIYSPDGINIQKDGTSIFSVDGTGSLYMPNDYNSALYLRRSKLQPCNGQNPLYCNWVRVNGADGNTYWALCGFSSYQGT